MDEAKKIIVLEAECGKEKFNLIKWILNNTDKNDLEIINNIQGIHSMKYKNMIKGCVNKIKNKCS